MTTIRPSIATAKEAWVLDVRKDFGQQIAGKGGLPGWLARRMEAIENGTGRTPPWYGLCDVGGCGNAATGPEVAIYVAETDDYLEVSLCDDHPELTALARDDEETTFRMRTPDAIIDIGRYPVRP